MTTVFQTLGQLATHLDGYTAGVEIVDPGMPLDEVTSGRGHPGAAFRKHPSVRKVTGFIARNVASIPLHLYERVDTTNRVRITDGELAAVLRSPRPKVTPYRFWHDVIMDQLLYDRYCVVMDASDGLRLTRLPAERVRFKTSDLGEVTKIRYTDKRGERVEFDPEDCIYDHGYSPRGPNGLSPVETLQDILDESAEAVAYRRNVWKNAAQIPQVIERPKDAGDWSDAKLKRFRSQWEAFKRGGGSEGGTPVLEDGMTVKEVTSFRPKDTLDIEGRKLTDAEVASAYYIAPELVGARDANYSNMESLRQSLYRDSLGPWISAWEQSLNAHLTPDWDDGRPLYIEANLDVKLRGSFEEQAKILQASTGGPWLTRNEARARANLPALDGADELIVPLNVIEGGQASPQDSAPTEEV